jgi:2-polyprenyl-6-methoxyphenol hydroxylase-like FAD-dependent oxidoreductase
VARVVVVGAGVGGLGAALALGRDGHDVTVLERDATPLPASADEAFAWDRRGAPQVRHSHAFLARLRNLLRDRFPDVLDGLLAAGASELRFAELLPPAMADRSPRPGDDDLVALACRRTTFEWVLRRSVLAAPGVRLLDGAAVDGLVAEPGAVPLVTGVAATVAGAPAPVPADLVVVATGRRSGLPGWFAAAGLDTVAEDEEDTGIVYFSRFYRLAEGADPPAGDALVAVDLGYLKFAVFAGDNRTFSVTLATGADDAALRSLLLEPAAFDATVLALPLAAPWLEGGRAEPLTAVQVMARLVNRRRRFVRPDGRPIAAGVAAVGDAHTCTNPLYGRGCSLAMVQAVLLADAVAATDGDPVATAVAYEEASEREVGPWYRAAVYQDRANRLAADEAGDRAGDGDDALSFRSLLRDGVLPAARTDPDVFRAFVRTFNLLALPDDLMTDAALAGRVLAAWQDRHSRPPEPPLGPKRDALLAVLAGRAA